VNLDSAYFDSSVFLAIFNGEESAGGIKSLLRELRREKCRVCTSILTTQEVSVASYMFGGDQSANYSKVDRLARIHGVTRDIALLAARLEASILARMKSAPKPQRQAMSPRRKLDCLHIASALELGCRFLYSLDPAMLKCRELVPSNFSITLAEPTPSSPELFPEGTPRGIHIQ
jgi:predicted nucleic acid-binding protein